MMKNHYGKRLKVIIVDDEVLVLEGLSTMIEWSKYSTSKRGYYRQ